MNLFITFIFAYFAVTVLFMFVLALAGRFHASKETKKSDVLNSIAILIPAYKEDAIIHQTIQSVLAHNYPANNCNVYVLADQLSAETLSMLEGYPLKVLTMHHDVSTKAKSLHAFFQLVDHTRYDIIYILDADNIMKENCLSYVNSAYNDGYKVIQCHRKSKNLNTAYSILDGLSEEIRITIFFAGQRAFGLSSDLIGSGMAFDTKILNSILTNSAVQNSIGEDKEMSLYLMKYNIKVEYLDQAVVYDEKISDISAFKKQRKRWIASQLNIVKRHFHNEFSSCRTTFRFWYHLLLNLLLPRSFYLVIMPLLIFIYVFLPVPTKFLWITLNQWLLIYLIYIVTLIIAIPSAYFNRNTLRALLKLPQMLFTMICAALAARPGFHVFERTPKKY